MKTIFNTIIFCISLSAFAQKPTYPDGIYMSLDQLKNKKPALQSKLEVVEHSKALGGKKYKLTTEDETIAKKFIKKKIYAYAQNDSLFINCFHHKLGFEYALAISEGPFIVFYIYGHDQSLTSSMGIGFGLAGALATAAATSGDYYYVLSLNTGNAKPLTKAYVRARIKDYYPELLDSFDELGKKISEEELTAYIMKINNHLINIVKN